MGASQNNLVEVMALAVKHHGESRFAEAEACYRQILAERMDHADAWNGLAILEWQQGHLNEALQNVAAATQHGPSVWRYHQTHGLIAAAMQRHSEAAHAFEQASTLRPESPEAWSGLAQSLHALRRIDDALAAYRRARSLAPLNAETANNFGVALESRGLIEEAVAVYRQALLQRPELIALYCNLGNALSALRRYAEAQAVLRDGLQRAPGSGELWYNLGNALAAQGASARCDRRVSKSP
jgi:protein O-GlcNAc transferase